MNQSNIRNNDRFQVSQHKIWEKLASLFTSEICNMKYKAFKLQARPSPIKQKMIIYNELSSLYRKNKERRVEEKVEQPQPSILILTNYFDFMQSCIRNVIATYLHELIA